MKKYNISTDLTRVIKNLYNKDTSAVLLNSRIGDWFQATVGVRQGCLVSPTLFKIFLQRIITDALEDHSDTDSTAGRTISNLRFADNIDGRAGEEEELTKLIQRLDKASTAYSSAEKTKLMKNNNIEIKVNGQKLKIITSSRYQSQTCESRSITYKTTFPTDIRL